MTRNSLFALCLLLASACAFALFPGSTSAAPVNDLSGGQAGRIEFNSSTPDSHWAIIRGRLGPSIVVWGDLLMPKSGSGKAPAVIFSHGSDGAGPIQYEVWAKPLNDAGYAVFIVDSFSPRNVEKVTGPTRQLEWGSVANLADALHALELLSTHPGIDSNRIFHMGWSRGGQVALWAAWPVFQQHILSTNVHWAGTIAIYPGCNMRYRVDHHSSLPSPILMLLGENDDITLPKPCMEYADELAAKGNRVSYKVYPGAYHVFDRPNQRWNKYKEGNYNLCSADIYLPSGRDDPSFARVEDRASGRTVTTPKEWEAWLPTCRQATWITVEGNPKVRDQAIHDALEFLRQSK
jgi:dienelactone hydrolase